MKIIWMGYISLILAVGLTSCASPCFWVEGSCLEVEIEGKEIIENMEMQLVFKDPVKDIIKNSYRLPQAVLPRTLQIIPPANVHTSDISAVKVLATKQRSSDTVEGISLVDWPDGKHISATINLDIASSFVSSDMAASSDMEPPVPPPPPSVKFTTVDHFYPGVGPSSIAVANIFGSAFNDLVVASYNFSTIRVLQGQKNAEFILKSGYSTAAGPVSITVGSFNSSPFSDIVVASSDAGAISVFTGLGSGLFQGQTMPYLWQKSDSNPVAVQLADLSGQGSGTVIAITDNQLVALSTGKTPLIIPTESGIVPSLLLLDDFNRDNKPDLIFADKFQALLYVLINQGNSTFSSSRIPYAGTTVAALASGDLDQDGNLDLIVSSRENNMIYVFPGAGNGTFPSFSSYLVDAYPGMIAVADFNGDGPPDLAVLHTKSPGHISILLNQTRLGPVGRGRFWSPTTLPLGSDAPHALAIGDFNGDHRIDLAITRPSVDLISILLNNNR